MPFGSSKGDTSRADLRGYAVNVLKVVDQGSRGFGVPQVTAPDFCNSNGTRQNTSASGQHEASETLIRLAV